MDFWLKARSFAEEAAKRSQEFTMEAAKRSQELTIGGSAKLSDVVLEASKRSKEIAAEASKRSKEIVAEASKRAEEIKVDALKRAEQITFQIPATGISHLVDSSSTGSTQTTAAAAAAATEADLERFGVTDELREFVKGITLNTFKDFPLQDDSEMSSIPTVSNIRQDLTEFQEKHAKLVLTSVKEISKLRYELCPRVMRERKFWRIYFILVNSHIAPYEKRYMEEANLKSADNVKTEVTEDNASSGTTSKTTVDGKDQKSKKTTSSASDQDLDVFLLGEDSDDGPDDGDDCFDEDFDKI
ncbi:PREDICTED: uncharacterized protein LOC109162841 [Ipomoea nil]|uniref:uncharacterized protein LOC109162841 n=1 Tax=Ipomoea nil TaxID=35883 RepID=UPI000900E217|nr:PREDICTED: uncharacterized protein LOC109162841 [Ipomoea nil]